MKNERSTEDLRRSDREARIIAQTVFDRPVVLQAGAGTGKTAALVHRVVAWCLGPGWTRADQNLRRVAAPGDPPPDAESIAARALSRVVAITFTEAAAAEMATRVDAALATIERGERPEGLLAESLPHGPSANGARAAALRSQLDRLVVRTIHAYCRRLLVSNCIEAGLHPGFEVDASGTLREEVVREVLEARLRDGLGKPDADPDLIALSAHEIGPFEIESALGILVSKGVPPEAFDESPFASERLKAHHRELQHALGGFFDAGGEELGQVSSRASRTLNTIESIRATRKLAKRRAPASPVELDALAEALREAWSDDTFERLGDWAQGKFLKTELQTVGEAADALAPAAAALRDRLARLLASRPLLLERARAVLRPLLADAHARLRARGIESFDALLVDARDLLEASPAARARERRRIDQLLVDEFQDTDALQCEVIRLLALDGPPQQRPGLFLVGDPKQSIYGWRNADLAAYQRFVDAVEAAGGKRYSLTENFRSVPPVLDEVSRVVAPVMEPRHGVQPEFERLIPSAERSASAVFEDRRRAVVEHWLPCDWDEEAGEAQKTLAGRAVEIEALALARDLRALHHEHGVAWRRIGVLFRTTTDLETYLVALRDAGVPYAVENDRSYYRRREIIDATALVRCIVDPNDHLALLAWLRSPSVGLPDAALIPLWTRGFPAQVSELESSSGESLDALQRTVAEAANALPGDVPGLERVAGWDTSVTAALEALGALRESFRSEPADVFLERVRQLSLLEATEAARYLGAYRVANLDRLFRELIAELEEGRDPQALLRRIRRAVGESAEAEGGRPLDSAEEAVQIMTIHGAKGLGFDHVYLMQLHKSRRGEVLAEAGEADGRLEYQLFGAPTLDFEAIARKRREVEEAERVRTLYVAMTRARERLVLSGLRPEVARGGAKASHMELLTRRERWPALGELGAARIGPSRARRSRRGALAGARAGAGGG
jgi:ATP-dependent exoDNAse (exonuclease V) beta subunit